MAIPGASPKSHNTHKTGAYEVRKVLHFWQTGYVQIKHVEDTRNQETQEFLWRIFQGAGRPNWRKCKWKARSREFLDFLRRVANFFV